MTRPLATAALLMALLAPALALALGDEPDLPTAAIPAPTGRPRFPFEPGASKASRPGQSEPRGKTGSAGWWLGPVGITLGLAALGVASLAARRLAPARDVAESSPRVVGRASLTPKHLIHLVRAGDRLWLVGTGPQGAPALLGEWEANDPPIGPSRPGAPG